MEFLPPNTYYRSFLAVITDTVAAVHTAFAMFGNPDQARQCREDAIEIKRMEHKVLMQCLGSNHGRTKLTNDQLGEMVMQDALMTEI